MESFGKRISELIRRKKITQIALAEHLGKSNSSVSDWVQGRSYPDAKTLAYLVDYFEVSADYLLNTKFGDAQVNQFGIGENSSLAVSPGQQLETLKLDLTELQKRFDLVNQINLNQTQIIKYLLGVQEVPKKVSEKLLKELSVQLQSIENQLEKK